MAVHRILHDWDKDAAVLRQRARRVRKVDESIQKLLDDMVETMRDAEGIGLAAPQIGVGLQALVIECPEDDSDPENPPVLLQMINPEIVRTRGEVEDLEGCLSLPGLRADVTRPERVMVKGLDREGRPMQIKAGGLLARALQHEIDHLKGILMLDRASQVYEIAQDEEGEPILIPLEDAEAFMPA